MGDCLVKDWPWRSYLGIGLANKLKLPASAVVCSYEEITA